MSTNGEWLTDFWPQRSVAFSWFFQQTGELVWVCKPLKVVFSVALEAGIG